MSKLGTVVKYAVVGTIGYWIGKKGLAYFRERAGKVVGLVLPKAQQALTAGYTQAMAITNTALEQAGIIAQVTPQVIDGRPSLVVNTPEGTDLDYASSQIPAVAAGMPVVVQ